MTPHMPVSHDPKCSCALYTRIGCGKCIATQNAWVAKVARAVCGPSEKFSDAVLRVARNPDQFEVRNGRVFEWNGEAFQSVNFGNMGA